MDIYTKKIEQKILFKKWLFLIAGMMFVLAIYLTYSSFFGSNVLYNEAISTSQSGVVLTSSEKTEDSAASSKPYLGIQVLDITDELAENLDLKSKIGVLVNQVFPNSPASEAGLKHGDIIVAYNNRTVKSVDRFGDLVLESEPGDSVRIVYLRDGKKDSTYAVLTAAPVSAIVRTAGMLTSSTDSLQSWGVSLAPVSAELQADFGLPTNVSGVVVLNVEDGGIADAAGLNVGDVITGVNQTAVSTLDGLFDAISKDDDTTAILDVYSNGRTRYVTIDTSGFQSIAITDEKVSTIVADAVGFLKAISPLGNVDTMIDENAIYGTQHGWLSTGNLQTFLPWIPVFGILGLLFAAGLYFNIMRTSPGDQKMQRIAEKIRSGAFVFLSREYRIIFGFIMGVFLLIRIVLDWSTAISFVLGASCSMLAGWIGIKASTQANVRTCQAAKEGGLWPALEVAFQGGAVMGISIASLGILGLGSVALFLYTQFTSGASYSSMVLVGFSLGASLVALFARVGGGIFTKSADMGADLVGKLELGIPEDDYRNPGVIADNVGDCVGDTAGMGADLFESYVGSVVSAIAVGLLVTSCPSCVYLPLVLICEGLIASVIAVMMLKAFRSYSPQGAIRMATFAAGVIFMAAAFVTILAMMGDLLLFWVVCVGVVCGLLIGWEMEMFTSGRTIRSIAHASETSSASTILTGFTMGFKSLVLPILTNCAAIFFAYKLGGFYGIAISAVGMLATVGIVMSADSFGPIADNAGGIAEMTGSGPDVRLVTDELDSVGNTTAAVGKGFAVSSAALTAMSFFSAYLASVGLTELNISSPSVSVGLMIGAMVPFVVAAMTMDSVNRVSQQMVAEIRKQFKGMIGLREGKVEPDSNQCIAIVTKGALQEIVIPGVTAVFLPLAVGIFMGKYALGGFLIGATISGIILGVVMANAGASWDNAKKWIEKGYFGGKGSSAHHAAVIGDTVGDPLKDTAGPSLNILIKLMALVSLLFASFLR